MLNSVSFDLAPVQHGLILEVPHLVCLKVLVKMMGLFWETLIAKQVVCCGCSWFHNLDVALSAANAQGGLGMSVHKQSLQSKFSAVDAVSFITLMLHDLL